MFSICYKRQGNWVQNHIVLLWLLMCNSPRKENYSKTLTNTEDWPKNLNYSMVAHSYITYSVKYYKLVHLIKEARKHLLVKGLHVRHLDMQRTWLEHAMWRVIDQEKKVKASYTTRMCICSDFFSFWGFFQFVFTKIMVNVDKFHCNMILIRKKILTFLNFFAFFLFAFVHMSVDILTEVLVK